MSKDKMQLDKKNFIENNYELWGDNKICYCEMIISISIPISLVNFKISNYGYFRISLINKASKQAVFDDFQPIVLDDL